MISWLRWLIPVRLRPVGACDEALYAWAHIFSFAPVTGALKYRQNAVVYVQAAVAVAPRQARLRELRAKAAGGERLTSEELKFIRQELNRGHIDALANMRATGGVVLVRIWVAANLLAWVPVVIAAANVRTGPPTAATDFYAATAQIFPVLAIAGFVEMAQGKLFERSGNLARILGFVVPLTAGEAVSLSALANHTDHPWMVHAITGALTATFGFLVAMLIVRALDAYTGGSNTPYVVAQRFQRYAATRPTDENGA